MEADNDGFGMVDSASGGYSTVSVGITYVEYLYSREDCGVMKFVRFMRGVTVSG